MKLFNNVNSVELSKRLKEQRNNKNLSFEKLHEELKKNDINISVQSLKDYEVTEEHHSKFDSAKGMKAETIYNLATYYGVSIDYLLNRTDLKSPNPDYINLHELTGLSDKAMITLEQAKNDKYTLLAINSLLENDSFANIVNNLANMLRIHDSNSDLSTYNENMNNEKYKYELCVVNNMENLRREVIESLTGLKYD